MVEWALFWLFGENLLVMGAASFALLGLAYEAGFRLGERLDRRRPNRDDGRTGVGTITASMLGLLSFTLGLTINYAQERVEARRGLVVQEANVIGTAWLRSRLVGSEEGASVATLIEQLAKVELASTVAKSIEPDLIARRSALQDRIWSLAQTVVRGAPSPVTTAMMMAINDMFDAELAERFAFDLKVPLILSRMLIFGALLATAAMGYQFGLTGVRHPALVSLLLVMLTGAMVYIADLNHPRLGSIRVDPTPLIWTIEGFTAPSPPR
jgi:hypothetical protein